MGNLSVGLCSKLGLKGISFNSNLGFLWSGNSDVQPVMMNKLLEVQHSGSLFFFFFSVHMGVIHSIVK